MATKITIMNSIVAVCIQRYDWCHSWLLRLNVSFGVDTSSYRGCLGALSGFGLEQSLIAVEAHFSRTLAHVTRLRQLVGASLLEECWCQVIGY